jgi:serine/threonine protein kinase
MRQVIDQYKMNEMIGEGGFGQVFRAQHKKTKEIVAVKTIDISDFFK